MKITCNIIQDMLPLYVDDVLSEDSRKMVEEHLKDCEACREKRRNMEEDSLPSFSQASENEKKAEKEILLGIRRRIRRKRLAAVLIGMKNPELTDKIQLRISVMRTVRFLSCIFLATLFPHPLNMGRVFHKPSCGSCSVFSGQDL